MQKQHRRLLWLLATLALVVTVAFVFISAFSPPALTLNGVAAPAGGDWPTYMHDIERTSNANDETILSPSNASQLTRLWAFKTGGGIAAEPVIVNGTVYIGSWDGYEYALDALTGALKWKTYLGVTVARCVPETIGITSTATVQNGVVYVGGGDSYWYVLSAATGQVLWRVFTGNNNADVGYYNWSSPLIYHGLAYIGVASDCDNPLTQGKLLVVSLQQHRIVKTLDMVPNGEEGGSIWSSPAVDPTTNTLYLTTGNMTEIDQPLAQSMLALNATTLAVEGAWQTPFSQSGVDSDWGGTPILFTDKEGQKLVVADNKNGFIYAFNRANISAGPIWELPADIGGDCPPCGDGTISSGTYGDGMLFMAGGNTQINGVGYAGAVRAINPATGTYIWQHGTPDTILASLVYANGLLIDGEGPVMEVLNAQTGQRLYSYQTGDDIYGAAAVSHGRIFIGSQDGYVYSFGLSTSPKLTTTDKHCPTGWSCQDIGVVTISGSETHLSATGWTLTGDGTGTADVSDQIHFDAEMVSGDVQLRAHIQLPDNAPRRAQAGLMVRQNFTEGAPFYSVFLSANGGIVVQYRTAFNGGLTITRQVAQVLEANYIEIQRSGDRFRAATSDDGLHYTLVPGSSITLVLPTQVLAGMFVASGTTSSTVTATFDQVYVGDKFTNTPVAPPSAAGCVQGWQCLDIGNPLLVGGQSFQHGTWTVRAAGTDIWNEYDQFHFVGKAFHGDGTVIAHIVSPADTDSEAKAGIMIRGGTGANAAYYGAFLTPADGLLIQYRLLPGLRPQIILTDPTVEFPVYLKIERWNNIFTTYTSSDGVNWTANTDSIQTIDMSNTVVGGLAATSHAPATLATDVFDHVSVTNTADPTPIACPGGWHCADIGYPTPGGTQIYDASSDTWTVEGGGFDIFTNIDQFHYVWQTMPGDGTISVHVVSQTADLFNPNSKFGPMIRAGTADNAAYYAILAEPQNGIQVQWRVQQGDMTGEYKLPLSYQMPIYLRITRVGNTFTSYVSQDGVVWTPIAGSTHTIDVSGPLMAGLAVTSHTPAALSVVTFNSVSIQP